MLLLHVSQIFYLYPGDSYFINIVEVIIYSGFNSLQNDSQSIQMKNLQQYSLLISLISEATKNMTIELLNIVVTKNDSLNKKFDL